MDNNMLQTQTPPAFEPPYVPPPIQPYTPPVNVAPAPADVYEDGGEMGTSLKDANWLAILVSALIIAAMFSIMYHTAQKIKFYKRSFNSFQSQINDVKNDVENINKDLDNQKMLVESSHNNMQYDMMGW